MTSLVSTTKQPFLQSNDSSFSECKMCPYRMSKHVHGCLGGQVWLLEHEVWRV